MMPIAISTSRQPKTSVTSDPSCLKCGAAENLIMVTHEGDGVYMRKCGICGKTVYSFPEKRPAPKVVKRVMTKNHTLHCACGAVEKGHTVRATMCKACQAIKKKSNFRAWYDANVRVRSRSSN